MTQDAMSKVMDKITDAANKELYSKTQEELEDYWYYNFDNDKNPEIRLFNFYEALKHYEYYCTKWEEHHNGSICIVVRVRDKYILPKIKLFLKTNADGVNDG